MNRLKKWPKNNVPVSFDILADSICNSIRQAYELKRINSSIPIPYEGYELPDNQLITNSKIREQLKPENIAWLKEDQFMDELQILIGIALSLGIEQGRRVELCNNE